MRIEEATVKLSASHTASTMQATELTMKSNFKQVFSRQLGQLEKDAAAERQRVATMLQSLVDAIIAAVQGKKCTEKLAADSAQACLPEEAATEPDSGYTFEWQCLLRETFCETEKTTIAGEGKVLTQDGREIDFNFAVDLSRQFKSEKLLQEAGSIKLQDPLVINFDGKASELTEQRLAFDLDADGQLEEIPGLAAGSGFLVLDRNGNGQIDDGSELFGVKSGNGFADLAEFDGDKNGWIDEGDAVFSELAVWSGGELASLKTRGVGALYTAAVDAPFSLKNEGNQLLGQLRAAGIYLSEAGEAGHLQQLDLAVSELPAGDKQPAKGERLAA